MLASVEFASELLVAIVGVYVRPISLLSKHFSALATEPNAPEFLCSICRQALRSVGLLAVQAWALAVLAGPVLHTPLAKHVLAVGTLFWLEDDFCTHGADELFVQSTDDMLFLQFWKAVRKLNPLVSRPQRAFLLVDENF